MNLPPEAAQCLKCGSAAEFGYTVEGAWQCADTSFEAEEDQKPVSRSCHDTSDTTSNKSRNRSDQVAPEANGDLAKAAREQLKRLRNPNAA